MLQALVGTHSYTSSKDTLAYNAAYRTNFKKADPLASNSVQEIYSHQHHNNHHHITLENDLFNDIHE